MKITVAGGTGYAGAAIVAEAVRRGHEVTALSRTAPATPADGVRYVLGDVLGDVLPGGAGEPGAVAQHVAPHIAQAVDGAGVVVGALSPRGVLEGQLGAAYAGLAEQARAAGARFVVVGGWSSLRLADGGPRVAETGQVPAQFAGEAREVAALLPWLQSTDEAFDWVFISPAASFGSDNPGQALGRYRVGGEVALFDAAGASQVSGADFALAVLDEIERPAHRREQIGIAY